MGFVSERIKRNLPEKGRKEVRYITRKGMYTVQGLSCHERKSSGLVREAAKKVIIFSGPANKALWPDFLGGTFFRASKKFFFL